MNQELAKNFIECLIFSASEPMHLKSLEKILSSHGDFNLKDIMEELIVKDKEVTDEPYKPVYALNAGYQKLTVNKKDTEKLQENNDDETSDISNDSYDN